MLEDGSSLLSPNRCMNLTGKVELC